MGSLERLDKSLSLSGDSLGTLGGCAQISKIAFISDNHYLQANIKILTLHLLVPSLFFTFFFFPLEMCSKAYWPLAPPHSK